MIYNLYEKSLKFLKLTIDNLILEIFYAGNKLRL